MEEKLTALQTGPFGVNTYIIPLANDAVVVVDSAACASTGDADKITGWLSNQMKTPAGIFITHGHFDHITGIAELQRVYPHCPVAIHKDDAHALGAGAASAQEASLEILGMPQLLDALADVPPADILFSGGETLASLFSGSNSSKIDSAVAVQKELGCWHIIHTPGHSPGSCCLYNAARKELISGDTLFYQSWGRTDLGGSERDIIKSLSMLKDTIPGDTLVYPGHGQYGFRLSDGL